MNELYVFQTDGDYAPFAIVSSEKGVLYTGDNIHNSGFEEYAEGYSDALGINSVDIWIESSEDLERHKDVLEKHNIYSDFKEYLSNFE